MDPQPTAKVDMSSAHPQLEEAPDVVRTSRSPKRQRVSGKTSPPRTPIEPREENLTDEEQALRIAEAKILFPKYMASFNSKPYGGNGSNCAQSPLLYLPSNEYGKWNHYCHCSPSALSNPARKSEIDEYFARDCRKPGGTLATYGPNPIELDPRYYDQEWNQRIVLCTSQTGE